MANVLLVDDATECLKPMADLLLCSGHQVECARNGLEALEALDPVTPDVVVVDLRMPVMDGVSFLQAVECSPAHHGRVPTIVLFGDLEHERERVGQARALGAKAAFDKSGLSPTALLSAIERYANN